MGFTPDTSSATAHKKLKLYTSAVTIFREYLIS